MRKFLISLTLAIICSTANATTFTSELGILTNGLLVSGSLNLSTAGFIVFNGSTPSTSNYAIYGDASQTNLNSASVVGFDIGNVRTASVTATGFGVFNANPSYALDVSGYARVLYGVIENLSTPASSSATCTTGLMQYDANYVYVCVAANTWKRAALGSF